MRRPIRYAEEGGSSRLEMVLKGNGSVSGGRLLLPPRFGDTVRRLGGVDRFGGGGRRLLPFRGRGAWSLGLGLTDLALGFAVDAADRTAVAVATVLPVCGAAAVPTAVAFARG